MSDQSSCLTFAIYLLVPGIIGCLQALEAIKIATHTNGEILDFA